MTSAMPSTSNVKRAFQAGIQRYDSRSWKRAPPALNCAHSTPVSTSTASDQPSATCLARTGRSRGMSATTAAPTSGATVSTDR